MPLPERASVVVMDTSTRRGLVESAYNERRMQCEAAAAFFEVPYLRDVSREVFEAQTGDMAGGMTGKLTANLLKRSRHVITENERTVAAGEMMKAGDLTGLGQLMDKSHDSLRDDYEVTNDALDTIVALARKQPGCYGARMTGGGFGGCAIALVEQQMVDNFVDTMQHLYTEKTALQALIYVCNAAEGVAVEDLPAA